MATEISPSGRVSSHLAAEHFLLEELPRGVMESMAERAAWFKTLPRANSGEEYLVSDVQAWRPGQVLRVAFLGGTTELHRDIAEATEQITQIGNIRFDFGFNPATGKFREWSTTDVEYAAEIRVSFDIGGYWSLVGTDSIDAHIGRVGEPAGGRPNQRSLNLGGFDVNRPARWKGTTRHEFLHAVAFHHEHQNLNGPCQHDFRWEDDAEYVPTKTDGGVFVQDSQGRRPGIYTYLSGAPNNWNEAQIDHNLRSESNAGNTAGTFDAESVMLYRFPALFYRSMNSLCAPTTDGENLSAGDKAGLRLLYPATGGAAQPGFARAVDLGKTLQAQVESAGEGLESMEAPGQATRAAVLHTLRRLDQPK